MWSQRLVVLGKKSGAWYLYDLPHSEHRQIPPEEIEEAHFPISELKPDHIQNSTLLEFHRYELLQPFSKFSKHRWHVQSRSSSSDLVPAIVHKVDENRL
jgi:hypothetical protein